MSARDVFLTGGTGYMGVRLGAELVARGHRVRALTRAASAGRLPANVALVIGDALDGATYAAAIAPADTFVHLVGTPHPNPSKAAEFERVDLASARAAVGAAKSAGIRHFAYVSVAQPAPVMRDYVAARARAEGHLRASALNATILRPWYVLGAGHWWPYALVLLAWVAERVPATRDDARRLGLVTIAQMVAALAHAVENPTAGGRVVEAPSIRGRLP